MPHRDDRYKLIEYAVEGRRRTQLFDLIDDPFELNDLADTPAAAEHIGRLQAELDRWRTDLGDTREQGRQFWAGRPRVD
jgi:arylsulfatase A-like enzyme